jgi:hypothetical protein
MERRRLKILIFLILIVLSCGTNDKKFDKLGWNEKDDFYFANRKIMVKDLMKNHLKKGMAFNELVELLGQPENYSDEKSNKVAYEIEVDYGSDIDPVAGSDLIIELSKDSTVVNFELVKWKH